eukprot:GHRR01036852.1.p1 GENE.GHRR01036852.1~~GHRR01036852.1.p1  ORF type:complete len:106 (+),score=33.11 GHRR01036852.1:164-481(+)
MHCGQLCLWRKHQPSRLYALLVPGSSNRATAISCKHHELGLTKVSHLFVSLIKVPAGGAGWYLLGRISRLTNRLSKAADCYVRALQKDPSLWVAFTELCMLGELC